MHITKRTIQIAFLGAAVAAPLLVACGGERAYRTGYGSSSGGQTFQSGPSGSDDTTITVDDWAYGGQLEVSDARLSGEIGDVRIADQAASVDGYNDHDIATVYSLVERAENGSAMTVLEFRGGLQNFTDPGTERFRADAVRRTEDPDRFVSAVGCSGVISGEWDYDTPAEEIELTVSDGPTDNTRTYDYTATFVDEDGGQTVARGSFIATIAIEE